MNDFSYKFKDEIPEQKYNRLIDTLKSYGSVAVAFSGGVDSTFLLYAAKMALGERAIAITVSADFVSDREQTEAKEFCQKNGIRQLICPVNMNEIEHFSENPKDRCYYCKRHIFSTILKVAGEQGILEVAEGSNLDDNADYRPGHKAIAELKIKSPLREVCFTKEEIRQVSKHFDLPTWSKPSFACLASRIPYGDTITSEKLSIVEKAEGYLHSLGFNQFRVRLHGSIARIELMPSDFPKFMEDSARLSVYEYLKSLGFSYITLDIKGFRSGSMNEGMSHNP